MNESLRAGAGRAQNGGGVLVILSLLRRRTVQLLGKHLRVLRYSVGKFSIGASIG
jgi:hypothetical protein